MAHSKPSRHGAQSRVGTSGPGGSTGGLVAVVSVVVVSVVALMVVAVAVVVSVVEVSLTVVGSAVVADVTGCGMDATGC